MFKMFLTLLRGRAAEAEQAFGDRHALAILDQQLRDVTASLERGRKALALTMAQEQGESQRIARTQAQIADLEARVGEAIDAGREALALEGAEAIARLEADRDAAIAAHERYKIETTRLRAHLIQTESRVLEVERGRRLARAAAAVMETRSQTDDATARATVAEAEATLKRLQERQSEADAAAAAFDELSRERAPQTTAEKLAEAGFGPRLRTTGQDVLDRLKSQRKNAA
ncbi:MAG: PspA/IM30 family protein [Methylobacteriaceae bacterium]|nr:PspA/IM30 family protein [Methylobacteriaceae bacterium]